MSRFARRVDGNHAEIKAALESIGVRVIDTSALGQFVDIVTMFRGHVTLVEIKDGSKPPSARKLTAAQIELHAKAREVGVTIPVVENVAQALALFGARMAA